MNAKQEAALGLYDKSSKNAVASRAEFSLSKSGAKNFYGDNELIQQIIDGEISMSDIAKDELPEKMKSMSKEERLAYVEQIKQEREFNLSRLQDLSTLRSVYIDSLRREDPEQKSFSEDVFKIISEQAGKKGVIFVK